MPIAYILLELFCTYGWDDSQEQTQEVPSYCKYGVKKPGYHCMSNDCTFNAFTYTEDAIACTEDDGEVKGSDGWVGIGGDMQPDYLTDEQRIECVKMWKEICRRKVNEAYEEYMAKTGFKKFSLDENG